MVVLPHRNHDHHAGCSNGATSLHLLHFVRFDFLWSWLFFDGPVKRRVESGLPNLAVVTMPLLVGSSNNSSPRKRNVVAQPGLATPLMLLWRERWVDENHEEDRAHVVRVGRMLALVVVVRERNCDYSTASYCFSGSGDVNDCVTQSNVPTGDFVVDVLAFAAVVVNQRAL